MNKYQNEIVIRKLNAFACMYGFTTIFFGGYWDHINSSLSAELIFFLVLFSALVLVSLFMLAIKYFIKGLFTDNNPKVILSLCVFIIINVLFIVISILFTQGYEIQNMPSLYARILIVCFINLIMNITSIFYVWSLRRKSIS
jgi:hypothetical protein